MYSCFSIRTRNLSPQSLWQIGAVLYSDFLQHNPKDPQWLNRDRFVLSGGHGKRPVDL